MSKLENRIQDKIQYRIGQMDGLGIGYEPRNDAYIAKSEKGSTIYIPVLDIKTMDQGAWEKLISEIGPKMLKIQEEGMIPNSKNEYSEPEVKPYPILLEAHDNISNFISEIKKEMDAHIECRNFDSKLTGERIETWDGILKELENIENEIKKEIKVNGAELSETELYQIRVTKTYEYDVAKLRKLIPDEAGFYIETKESVKKAGLDKAIKEGLVPEIAKEALKEKSTSIAFIDKAKIAAQEEKTISV